MTPRPALLLGASVALALLLGLPIFAGLAQMVVGGIGGWADVRAGAIGFTAGAGLSLWIATLATLLSLLGAVGLAASFSQRARLLTWFSLPLLAIPHAAVAQALGLLLAPSGFLVRLLSPWATGFERPPSAWLLDQHPDGWTLIAALAIKELPFFLILLLTHSASLPVRQWQGAAQALGYGPRAAWWHLALPQLLPRLALPLFVVLAFTLSVVDVAALVGPSLSKTLAHRLHVTYQGGEPWALVLAGATALSMLTAATLTLTWAILRGIQWHLSHAQRWARSSPVPMGFALVGGGILALAYLALVLLPIQSLIETSGRRTRFPDVWTGKISLNGWAEGLSLTLPTLPATLLIAALATALSLLACLCLLEGLGRQHRLNAWLSSAIMVPLLVPQFAFLSGGLFLGIRLDLIPALGGMVAVWFHFLFVFPYVYLIFAPAHRGLSPAYALTASSLGLAPWAQFWRVRLPLLLRPLAFAAAWGMAVSFALYLPTFFASAGRIETLLTLGVTQLSGQGDQVRAVWGLLLLGLPFAFFALAALIAGLQARGRRGLRP